MSEQQQRDAAADLAVCEARYIDPMDMSEMTREALPWWIAEAERLRAVIAAAERILTEKTSWAGVSAPSYVTISEHDLQQLLKMLREVNR